MKVYIIGAMKQRNGTGIECYGKAYNKTQDTWRSCTVVVKTVFVNLYLQTSSPTSPSSPPLSSRESQLIEEVREFFSSLTTNHEINCTEEVSNIERTIIRARIPHDLASLGTVQEYCNKYFKTWHYEESVVDAFLFDRQIVGPSMVTVDIDQYKHFDDTHFFVESSNDIEIHEIENSLPSNPIQLCIPPHVRFNVAIVGIDVNQIVTNRPNRDVPITNIVIRKNVPIDWSSISNSNNNNDNDVKSYSIIHCADEMDMDVDMDRNILMASTRKEYLKILNSLFRENSIDIAVGQDLTRSLGPLVIPDRQLLFIDTTICSNAYGIGDKSTTTGKNSGDKQDEQYETALRVCDEIIKNTQRFIFKTNLLLTSLCVAKLAGCPWSTAVRGSAIEQNRYIIEWEFLRSRTEGDSHSTLMNDYVQFMHDRKKGLETKKRSRNENDKDNNGGKKKSSYEGGLILEPIVGYYPTPSMLLDFASLYPSVIIEFNLCFTTNKSLVPRIMDRLVSMRRSLREKSSTSISGNGRGSSGGSSSPYSDSQQLACKRIANSLYGCFGNAEFRFSNQDLAERVAKHGRMVLSQLVEDINSSLPNIGKIVFGHTDSVIINIPVGNDNGEGDGDGDTPLLNRLSSAWKHVNEMVTKRYKHVRIKIETVFLSLIIQDAQSYAGHHLSLKTIQDAMDGNETVFNDIPFTSKGSLGRMKSKCRWANNCLEDLLKRTLKPKICDSEITKQEICEQIRNEIREVQQEMERKCIESISKGNKNSTGLNDFILSRTLSKHPSQYHYNDLETRVPNDPQSFVLLANQLIKTRGFSYRQGDAVRFVVAKDDMSVYLASKSTKPKTTTMLIHPCLFENTDSKNELDEDFYLKTCVRNPFQKISTLFITKECSSVPRNQISVNRLRQTQPKRDESKSVKKRKLPDLDNPAFENVHQNVKTKVEEIVSESAGCVKSAYKCLHSPGHRPGWIGHNGRMMLTLYLKNHLSVEEAWSFWMLELELSREEFERHEYYSSIKQIYKKDLRGSSVYKNSHSCVKIQRMESDSKSGFVGCPFKCNVNGDIEDITVNVGTRMSSNLSPCEKCAKKEHIRSGISHPMQVYQIRQNFHSKQRCMKSIG
jgi:DNA polymerase elongation subunit (family B)